MTKNAAKMMKAKPQPPGQRRTSISHPILVDWVETGLPGRLGMTFAPGKKDEGGLTAIWDRNLPADVGVLARHHKVDVLVPLVEWHELKLLQIPDLLYEVGHAGMASIYYPFPDVSVPHSMASLHELVRELVKRLEHGENIVVHCRGGLGRTGLVVACCLILMGMSAADAIAETRASRKGTIQTPQQEWFVEEYERFLTEPGPVPEEDERWEHYVDTSWSNQS